MNIIPFIAPNQKMLTPEEELDLITKWQTNQDKAALTTLVKAFMPLVYKYVRRFSMYGLAKDELVSVGMLALMETSHKFKLDKDCRFATYATRWIEGMMLIYVASNYFAFSLKHHISKKLFFGLRKEMARMQQEDNLLEWNEMADKLAEKFEVERKDLDEVYTILRNPGMSINAPRGDGEDGDSTMEDVLESGVPDPENRMVEEQSEQLRKELVYTTMVEALTHRERIIIKAQMMMEQDEDMTLQDLADQFHCSRERIRQIRNKAMEKLTAAIRVKCQKMDYQGLMRN